MKNYNYHITKDGGRIRLDHMKDSHLINTVKRIKRLAKEGVVLESGFLNLVCDDFSYDKEFYYDEKAEEMLELDKYLIELGIRKYNKITV